MKDNKSPKNKIYVLIFTIRKKHNKIGTPIVTAIPVKTAVMQYETAENHCQTNTVINKFKT